MSIKTLSTRLLAVFAAGALFAAATACEPELTDSREFDLSYPGITDIAPSTNINITPTWIGGTPSEFKVYRVKHDGEAIETECFSVDEVAGTFYVRNTDALETGLYTVSISCKAGGKKHQFPDIISINMMRPVPTGIKVEPALIEVSLEDVIDESSTVALPSAQIVTEGEHISITKYAICGAKRNGTAVTDYANMFKVSGTGEVSIIRSAAFVPGDYLLSFKLNTYVVDDSSQEGIFTDALTVKVNSAPLALEYYPATGKAEVGTAFSSVAPTLMGTANGAVYSLKSVTPAGAPLAIDAATGVISLPAGNTLEIGTVCTASVNVRNAFGEKDFDDVYSVTVVAFINPITKLNYADTAIIEGTKVDLAVKEVDGDDVTFSFVDLPDALQGQISIDAVTGTLSFAKDNTAPIGSYTVKVKAENIKNSVTDEFALEIQKNIYKFSFVRWGNNLGLTPVEKYANQFKITSTTDVATFPVIASDIPDGIAAEFSVKGGSKTGFLTVDAATGELSVDPTVFETAADRRVHFCFILVKTGVGTPAECQVNIPVFFNFHCAHGGYEIEFVPFVFQCNPRTGGVSVAPTITPAVEPASNFTFDFRRSFNYWNVAGPASHIDGQPSVADGFLHTLWAEFFAAINKAINTGSRDPVSCYGRANTEATRPCYFRIEDHALLVNPNKWKDDAGFANGIFMGQVTFAVNGADPQGAAADFRIFPLAVWFDTAFSN